MNLGLIFFDTGGAHQDEYRFDEGCTYWYCSAINDTQLLGCRWLFVRPDARGWMVWTSFHWEIRNTWSETKLCGRRWSRWRKGDQDTASRPMTQLKMTYHSCDLGCQSWWKLMRLRQMWTAVCKWPCTARALGAFQNCGTADEVLVLEGTSPCIHGLQNRSTTTTTTRDVKLTMCPQISCSHVVLYICIHLLFWVPCIMMLNLPNLARQLLPSPVPLLVRVARHSEFSFKGVQSSTLFRMFDKSSLNPFTSRIWHMVSGLKNPKIIPTFRNIPGECMLDVGFVQRDL